MPQSRACDNASTQPAIHRNGDTQLLESCCHAVKQAVQRVVSAPCHWQRLCSSVCPVLLIIYVLWKVARSGLSPCLYVMLGSNFTETALHLCRHDLQSSAERQQCW